VQSYAQNTAGKHLVRSTVGVSGSSTDIKIQNTNYVVQQIGQSRYWHIAIGDLNVRQGFIQPNVFAKIITKNTYEFRCCYLS
jgi:hypothetical protein